MKRRLALLALFTAALFAQSTQTFLVVYKPGPKFIAGKPIAAQPLGEHGRYMMSLYQKGILKIAGPFTDDAGGAVMFSAATPADAKSIVEHDPAVINGIFSYDLHPWGLVDWQSRANK
ncbi:MAG: YciI family protein [Acidobacteriia bacterium]|nr:YciI family protein [Terriglobia bacterium]